MGWILVVVAAGRWQSVSHNAAMMQAQHGLLCLGGGGITVKSELGNDDSSTSNSGRLRFVSGGGGESPIAESSHVELVGASAGTTSAGVEGGASEL